MILAINTLVAGVLFFCMLCRLSKTTYKTPIPIRLSLSIIAGISMIALIHPIATDVQPSIITVVLLAGGALSQIILAFHWGELTYQRDQTLFR